MKDKSVYYPKAPSFLNLNKCWDKKNDAEKISKLNSILSDPVLEEAFAEIHMVCFPRTGSSHDDAVLINNILCGMLMTRDALKQLASSSEDKENINLSDYEDTLE